MELLQLQYFLLLANQQHVTRTAELLHISQPALSLTIKKLEAELGVPLFIRRGRNIVLSPYGEAFKQHVEDAFFSLENGKRALARMQKAGSLRILSILLDHTPRSHPQPRLSMVSVHPLLR